MLILRIRRAEVALADGRLDEAYEQAVREDVRQHRRGQRLADRLVKRLTERGQLHAGQGQFPQALFDYERAVRIGGHQAELTRLQDEARRAWQTLQDEQRRRNQLVHAAKRQIQRGELSLGSQVVHKLGDEDRVSVELADEIALKRDTTEALLQRAEAAWRRQDYGPAIAALLEANRAQPGNQRAGELAQQVTREVVHQAKDALHAGRLDQASICVRQITPLSGDHWEVVELSRALKQARDATARIQQGQLQSAQQNLTRLMQLLPDADWVKQAALRMEQALAAVAATLAGPLGILDSQSQPTADRGTRSAFPPSRLPRTEGTDDAYETVPAKFLLQIDGAGSYVVSRAAATSIGPSSSSRPPDISLLAPSHMPSVQVERLDGDYFLRATRPVRVNDREVTEKLLADGDQIVLGPRCSFRFLLPHAASTTAVLELTGARMSRQDVRRVVLLDQSLVIGSSRNAHIVVHEPVPKVILHLRGEQLCQRQAAGAGANGRLAPSSAIPLGRPIQVGDVALVLTDLSEPSVI